MKNGSPPYRVVLIDDDEAESELLREAIAHSSVPIELILFRCPLKASEWLESDAQGVDMIISDINMRPLSGIELIQRLNTRPATAEIPKALTSNSHRSQFPAAILRTVNAPCYTKVASWGGYLLLARELLTALAGSATLGIDPAARLARNMEAHRPAT